MNSSHATKVLALLFVGVASLSAYAEDRSVPFRVDFAPLKLKQGQSFSTVRVQVTCGRIVSINRIPDDWYVSTQRTDGTLERKEQDSVYQAVVVEFDAGHGVSRMTDIAAFNGAVTVLAEVESCFKVTAAVADEMTDEGPKPQLVQTRLRK